MELYLKKDPEKKSNEKVYNYKEKYPTKPQFKKKEIYSYKPQKEYVPKTTSSEENKEISDNPEKKSWRKEKKDHKKCFLF